MWFNNLQSLKISLKNPELLRTFQETREPCSNNNFYSARSFLIPTCPTHTHPFNVPFSGTTQVSRYQKGKTNLDFTEARDSEWQWNQLDHMQVCTSLQTDNHASTPSLCFLQAGCPSCRPTNSVKALKVPQPAQHYHKNPTGVFMRANEQTNNHNLSNGGKHCYCPLNGEKYSDRNIWLLIVAVTAP